MSKMVARFRGVARKEKEITCDHDDTAATQEDEHKEIILNNPTLKYLQNVVTKHCRKCNSVKPPLSHHCSICERCIARMDHHCPWVNNCVGYYN